MPPTGRITRLQRFSTHDGPGIRTTVFLKGCPLGCLWCHNPEAIRPDPQLMYFEERCRRCGACTTACPEGAHLLRDGRHELDRSRCRLRLACVEACPFGALESALQLLSAPQVLEILLRDAAYYRGSGGGVTISGGEPLLQAEFTGALLREAGAAGLHTAVDTCLQAPWEAIASLAPRVDLWLVDVKLLDPAAHERFTGRPNTLILENLQKLDSLPGASLWVRLPLIEEVNADPENLARTVELLRSLHSVARVQPLPYHALGVVKRQSLGQPEGRPFSAPSAEKLGEFRRRLREAKLPVDPEE